MCGLCGMAGRGILSDEIKVFKDLLYVTALRGDDSTGVYAVNHDKPQDGRIRKSAVDAGYFMWEDRTSKLANEVITPRDNTIMMGHCRSATVGSVNVQNAHPFDVGRFVGAHNGTLTDTKYTKDKSKTDSQAMFEAMTQEGIQPVLEDLNGSSAFAVSIFDKSTKRLLLGRNSQRPLFMAFDDKKDVMFWASEESMLRFALARHNREATIFRVAVDTMYAIDVDEVKAGNHTPYDSVKMDIKTYVDPWEDNWYSSYGGSNIPEWRQGQNGQWYKVGQPGDPNYKKTVNTKNTPFSLWDGGDWRCAVCDDVTNVEPTKEFQKGEYTAFCCKSCSAWVGNIDAETGEITPTHNTTN